MKQKLLEPNEQSNSRFPKSCLRRQGCSVWPPKWMLRDPAITQRFGHPAKTDPQWNPLDSSSSTGDIANSPCVDIVKLVGKWMGPFCFWGMHKPWLGRQHVGGPVPISSADGERGLTRSEREDGYLAPCWPAQERNWTIRPREMHQYPTLMLPSVVGMLRGYDWPRDGRCSC